MNRSEILNLIANGRLSEWNMLRKRHAAWAPDLSGLDLRDSRIFAFLRLPPSQGLAGLRSDVAAAVARPPARFDLKRANLCSTKFPAIRSPQYTNARFTPVESACGAYFADVATATCQAEIIWLPHFEDAIYDVDTAFGTGSIDLEAMSARLATSFDREVLLRASELRVFVSYAWANADQVTAIDQWLRLRGINTLMDRRDFFAGGRISDEIARVMSECNVVLICYTKEASGKPWIQFEKELAQDLIMDAKTAGREPLRIVYLCLDDSVLPTVSDRARIAITAKGRKFPEVCQEIHDHLVQRPRVARDVDLRSWDDFVF